MFTFLGAYESVLAFAIIYAMFALSTFVALWSGVLSLASVTSAAVAAFGAAKIQEITATPVWLLIPIAAALGGIAAYLISLPLLRLSSHWMALASIAVVLITRVVVLALPGITGGPNGISVPRHFATFDLLLILVVSAYVCARARRAKIGMAAETVREDAAVAASLGINVVGTQRFTFIVSGMIGGLGGLMLADMNQYINADTYYTDLMFLSLAAVVLGGAFHWLGPIVGAAVYTIIPEISRDFFPHASEIVRGAVLIIIIIFLPRGIVDPNRRFAITRLFHRRRPEWEAPALVPDPADPQAAPSSGDR